MATCKEAYRFICDNLDQTLHSPRCRAIRRHLASCPDCRVYLDSVKKTVTLYRILPSPGVPSSTHHVLVRAIAGLQARAGRAGRKR